MPPGWYPDPSGAPGQRYWNGTDWAAAPQAQAAPKEKNTLGLVALILSIIGFIFACIPGALIIGWVLLPVAFILGIVALFQPKAKGTAIAAVIVSVVGVIVGVTVFLTVVQDAFEDAFSESDFSPSSESDASQSSPPASDTNSPDRASGEGDSGSRNNPLPIGSTVSNPEWEVTLGEPHEAWAEILAENQFNDPPEAGMEYWIVPITATYTGDDTGTPWIDITVEFVGSDNRTYSDNCGVVPDQLMDVDELYPDGVATGNTCVAVPAGADGLWALSTGYIGKPTFFDAN